LRTSLAASASPEGRTLLTDLRLLQVARSHALVDLATEALKTERPGCALALGQLALDHEAPRSTGPINPPTLYAILASAQLSLGRTREALDALAVLDADFPVVNPVEETVGTLAVLEGLDRHGESRE
jgi:hypothetical protein